MSNHSNLSYSLERVAELKHRHPGATHIYLRREDDVLVDIPVAQVESTLRLNPEWLVESASIAQTAQTFRLPLPKIPLAEAKQQEIKIPPKPSETAPPTVAPLAEDPFKIQDSPNAPQTNAPTDAPKVATPTVPKAPKAKAK